jgi:hypothetical protein
MDNMFNEKIIQIFRLPIILLFCIGNFYALSQFAPASPASTTIFRIDPTYARNGAASLFIDSLEFIPLQTNKESYFGRIDKLIVSPHHFIILDRETDAILIFKKNGHFSKKISAIPSMKKKGRNGLFASFVFNYESNEIIAYSNYEKSKGFVFDLQGQYKGQEKMPDQISDLEYISNGFRAYRPTRPFYVGGTIMDTTIYSNYSLVISNLNDSTQNLNLLPISYNSSPKENEVLGRYFNFNTSGKEGPVFFKRYFDYSIYEIDSLGVKRIYSLIFPQNNMLPKDYYSSSVENKGEIFVKQDVYFAIKSAYQLKNLLSLSLDVFGVVSKNKPELLYDTITGNSLYLGGVQPDALTYNLQAFTPTSSIDACDGSSFYTSVPSLILFKSKEAAKSKTIFNKVLTNYFASETIKSNPVIIRFIPKGRL